MIAISSATQTPSFIRQWSVWSLTKVINRMLSPSIQVPVLSLPVGVGGIHRPSQHMQRDCMVAGDMPDLPATSQRTSPAFMLALGPGHCSLPFASPCCSQCLGNTLDDPVSLSDSVFDEYLKTTGKPIEASIRGELSGDFEKLMLAVGMFWCCISRASEGVWDSGPGTRGRKWKRGILSYGDGKVRTRWTVNSKGLARAAWLRPGRQGVEPRPLTSSCSVL